MQEVQFNSNFTLDDYKKVSYFNVFGRKRLVPILCVVLLLVGIVYLIPNSFWGFSPPYRCHLYSLSDWPGWFYHLPHPKDHRRTQASRLQPAKHHHR